MKGLRHSGTSTKGRRREEARKKESEPVNVLQSGLPFNWVDDTWVWVADSLFGYLVFGVQPLFGWVFGWFALFGGVKMGSKKFKQTESNNYEIRKSMETFKNE